MSAFGTFPCYAPPKGLSNTRGVAPHPTFATWQGCRGKPPAPLPRSVVAQPVKAKPQAVASQALTGFQLRLLRIVLLPPRRWRGVKGGVAVHFTLDALESTPTLTVGVGG